METTTFEYGVDMACGGCSGAVTKALNSKKAELGGESVKIDASLEAQKVTVTVPGALAPGSEAFNAKNKEIFEIISKTGKKTRDLQAEKPAAGQEAPAA
ncbi:hypothetical protein H4R18_000555 [Coemansia javaensis]|uniref:HMA domain-containing protein n=1 Tax=Coemansia javaensis TaxID=2761396 RepID=A0A9W8LLH6_9FUNG|nr:hypothetical protein H4R18_000555 [Coemansia javaensis]